MLKNWIARFLKSGDAGPNGRTPDPGLWHAAAGDDPGAFGAVIDAPDLLQTELERARRYERGLSVVVLAIEPLSGTESEPSTPPQMVSLLAAAGLRGMVRQTDVLCYQPAQDRFVMGLTECTAEEAGQTVARISQLVRERLRLGIRAGIAQFPDDALTLAELVTAAGATADGEGRTLDAWTPGKDGSPIVSNRPMRTGPGSNGNGNGRRPAALNGPGRRSRIGGSEVSDHE